MALCWAVGAMCTLPCRRCSDGGPKNALRRPAQLLQVACRWSVGSDVRRCHASVSHWIGSRACQTSRAATLMCTGARSKVAPRSCLGKSAALSWHEAHHGECMCAPCRSG